MAILPEMFPEFSEEKQKALMSRTATLWSHKTVVLDTMTACAHFKIPPKETNKIINYVISQLEFRSYILDLAEPKLTGKQRLDFIEKVSKRPDLWLVNPILQVGFMAIFEFLAVFGGRMYYLEQLVTEGTPFSLSDVVNKIATEKGLESFRSLIARSRQLSSYMLIPKIDLLLTCFTKKVRDGLQC